MTDAPVPLAEQPTPEQDDARLAKIRRDCPHYNRAFQGTVQFLLRLVAQAEADRDATLQQHEGLTDQLAQQSIDLANAISRANEAEEQHERAMAALREPTQEIVEAAIAAAGSDDDRSGSEMAIDIMKAVLLRAVLDAANPAGDAP